jgi:hypothetical protein
MSKLAWDQSGERFYEVGADRGVLYTSAGGVPWNGLVSVNEAPSASETEAVYIDGVKYANASSIDETFDFTIEAITYPDEFGVCEGTVIEDGIIYDNQPVQPFGFSYRTLIGNEVSGVDKAYKIHLVYNCYASRPDKSFATMDDSSDIAPFTWDVTTVPPDAVTGCKESSHFFIDTREIPFPQMLAEFEAILYGSETTEPRLPTPAELALFFADWFILRVTVNEDGTWTATGPDALFNFPTADSFEITWDSVVYLDADTYTISSL